MLVLERKKNQKIMIGDRGEIEIMIVELGGGRVKLGITAPQNVPVHREEIFTKIQEAAA